MENKNNTPQSLGSLSEKKVQVLLSQFGHTVRKMPYIGKYDLLVDDKHRVEVKCSSCSNKDVRPTWIVNFHRHGKLDESNVDFYIVRLEDVPFSKQSIHLLFFAPIKRPTIRFTFRSLIYLYGNNAKAFISFRGHIKEGKVVDDDGELLAIG